MSGTRGMANRGGFGVSGGGKRPPAASMGFARAYPKEGRAAARMGAFAAIARAHTPRPPQRAFRP